MRNSNTAIFTRRVDELGRVVLPKDVRDKTHISIGGMVNIFCNDKNIIIENERASCIICGSNEDIKESIGICQKCIECIKNDEFDCSCTQ